MSAANDRPLVSVVMSMYNAAPTVREAVTSILAQRLGDLELLIVDDRSTDESVEIVRSLADPRIRLLQGSHSGLADALNLGIAAARAPFIARMDADDRSEPERLEIQYCYLRARPEVAMVGTWYRTFGDGGQQDVRLPTDDSINKYHLYTRNPFAHGTMMLRAAILRQSGLYRFRWGEDYDLWLRIAEQAQVQNIPLFLYNYRVSAQQVMVVRAAEAERTARGARRCAIQRYLGGRDALGHPRPSAATPALHLMMQSFAQAALKKGNSHLALRLLRAEARLGLGPSAAAFGTSAGDALRRISRYLATRDIAYLHFGAAIDKPALYLGSPALPVGVE